MRHRLRTRAGAAIVAALLAGTTALVGATGASAHEERTRTRIGELFVGSFGASGHLESSKGRCLRNRTVTVFRKLPNGEEVEVGSTTTGSDGGFFLDQDLPPGEYFVVVAPKVLRNDGSHRHTCKGKTSATESF